MLRLMLKIILFNYFIYFFVYFFIAQFAILIAGGVSKWYESIFQLKEWHYKMYKKYRKEFY